MTAVSTLLIISPLVNAATTSCQVTINNELYTYRACFQVSGVGRDYWIYWSIDPVPDNANASLLSMAMSAEAKGTSAGYVAIGFPIEPGSMDDAGAVILKSCSSCPSGAVADAYDLTGTEVDDVILVDDGVIDNVAFSNLTASKSSGMLSGSFVAVLSGSPFANTSVAGASTRRSHRRRTLLGDEGGAGGPPTPFPVDDFPFIFSSGVLSSSGNVSMHLDRGSSDHVNLLLGAPEGVGGCVTLSTTSQYSLKLAHQWISTIGWGFIVPLAILQARSLQPHLQKNALWFHLHRALALFGYTMATVGVILGFVAFGSWDFPKAVHRNLGVAATVLGAVQLLSLTKRIRVPRDHPKRKYWYFFHSWTGRSATILAIANIYYGIINMEALGAWAYGAYSGVLGAIVLVGIVMEFVNYKERKRMNIQKPDVEVLSSAEK